MNGDGAATVPDHTVLERLRGAFTATLYEMVTDPRSLRALRNLLTHRDPGIRLKAWQMVLPYLAGSGDAADTAAATQLLIVNHVPRLADQDRVA